MAGVIISKYTHTDTLVQARSSQCLALPPTHTHNEHNEHAASKVERLGGTPRRAWEVQAAPIGQ